MHYQKLQGVEHHLELVMPTIVYTFEQAKLPPKCLHPKTQPASFSFRLIPTNRHPLLHHPSLKLFSSLPLPIQPGQLPINTIQKLVHHISTVIATPALQYASNTVDQL